MSDTLGQVLTYIDTLLPNSLTTATKVDLINNEQRKIFEQMTSTSMYEFDTVVDQALYTLPNDCTIDLINENGVLISNSTDAITSTTLFQPYTYKGPDEELNGNNYYEALDNIGIYPVPNKTGYKARIKYQTRPLLFASTDTTVQFNLNQDYIDIIKFKVMSRIAKSGNTPDVELANNYEADSMQIEKKLRMERYKKQVKTPRSRWSYKEDWD